MCKTNVHRTHINASAPVRTVKAVLAVTKSFNTPTVTVRRENLAVHTCALISIMLVPISPSADIEIIDVLLSPQTFAGDEKNEKE